MRGHHAAAIAQRRMPTVAAAARRAEREGGLQPRFVYAYTEAARRQARAHRTRPLRVPTVGPTRMTRPSAVATVLGALFANVRADLTHANLEARERVLHEHEDRVRRRREEVVRNGAPTHVERPAALVRRPSARAARRLEHRVALREEAARRDEVGDVELLEALFEFGVDRVDDLAGDVHL